ncbi:hypothetical protein GCM10012275_56210 [Longimycelium tulufanense]|uniref:Uncharacterized protein n=1 Tax=Longimycelium tulufanense TaxID=907463 RepID=A0A8J3FYS3_9PSEU|nr:hypothetical protein GCM10012275_56210 [Longimycelium tulufanense]
MNGVGGPLAHQVGQDGGIVAAAEQHAHPRQVPTTKVVIERVIHDDVRALHQLPDTVFAIRTR